MRIPHAMFHLLLAVVIRDINISAEKSMDFYMKSDEDSKKPPLNALFSYQMVLLKVDEIEARLVFKANASVIFSLTHLAPLTTLTTIPHLNNAFPLLSYFWELSYCLGPCLAHCPIYVSLENQPYLTALQPNTLTFSKLLLFSKYLADLHVLDAFPGLTVIKF